MAPPEASVETDLFSSKSLRISSFHFIQPTSGSQGCFLSPLSLKNGYPLRVRPLSPSHLLQITPHPPSPCDRRIRAQCKGAGRLYQPISDLPPFSRKPKEKEKERWETHPDQILKHRPLQAMFERTKPPAAAADAACGSLSSPPRPLARGPSGDSPSPAPGPLSTLR